MKTIHESSENYLETILFLREQHGKVKSIDVANKLNFSRASVSRAMSILTEKKLITIDEQGYIDFTDEGTALASKIQERHKLLTDFFSQILKVDKDTAEEDACKIEHIISEETINKIKEFYDKKA